VPKQAWNTKQSAHGTKFMDQKYILSATVWCVWSDYSYTRIKNSYSVRAWIQVHISQRCAILSKVNPSCPICLLCLEDLVAAEITVNQNRLKGMLKYKIWLPPCVSSQEGARQCMFLSGNKQWCSAFILSSHNAKRLYLTY